MNFRPSLLAIVLAAAALIGCSSPKVADYAQQGPVLELDQYFNGRVLAHGMFRKRNGEISQLFVVTMDCSWDGNQGLLDETFTYADGRVQRRVWRLTKHADGRYTGTADDVVGKASGQTSGNAFHWRYTLLLPVGDKEYEVQFDDWMFLVDDKVMLNRAAMSKFGIGLGEVLLSFRKE